jgi:hypothetical protein
MYVKLFTAGNSLLPLLVHTTSYPHGDNTLFLPHDTEECASPKKKSWWRRQDQELLHAAATRIMAWLSEAGRRPPTKVKRRKQKHTARRMHASNDAKKEQKKKRTLCMCLCASSLFGCCPVPTMNRAKHSGRFSIQTSASENAPVSVHVMRLV